MKNNFEDNLQERGIKPTAIRILIFKEMQKFSQAFSLQMLEEKLGTVDKSTVFRTISLFHGKHLIHSIDDGSGAIKYSICSQDCNCEIEDLHPHFFCNNCRQTLCLSHTHIPKVQLPDKYILSSINFVLKGLCEKCSFKVCR
jgi:Fur family ferric uptake transcriptional regulator